MEFTLAGFGLEAAMDVSKGGLWHFGFHMAPDIPELLVTGREREYIVLLVARCLQSSRHYSC